MHPSVTRPGSRRECRRSRLWGRSQRPSRSGSCVRVTFTAASDCSYVADFKEIMADTLDVRLRRRGGRGWTLELASEAAARSVGNLAVLDAADSYMLDRRWDSKRPESNQRNWIRTLRQSAPPI